MACSGRRQPQPPEVEAGRRTPDGKGVEALGAQTMLRVFTSFEFVFLLHMMNEIFEYTNELCNALQKREQDIVNAMDLLQLTNVELDVLRRDAG